MNIQSVERNLVVRSHISKSFIVKWLQSFWGTMIVCAVFSLFGYWFSQNVASKIIAQDAHIESMQWSSLLNTNASDMQIMLQGLRPSENMQETLGKARIFGNVVEVSVHDLDGNQTFHKRIEDPENADSEEAEVVEEVVDLLKRFPTLKSTRTSVSDSTIVLVREADDIGEVGIESEVVFPLIHQGRIVGYSLIELELTNRWNALLSAIRPLSLASAFLFGLFPLGFGFALRSKTKNIDTLTEALATDPLTEIGSRQALYDLEKNLNQNELGMPIGTTIFYLDVDKFKYFNDNFGHEFGDEVLKAIGQHARNIRSVHSSLQAFRLGGDEFVFVVQDLPSDEIALEIAGELQHIPHFANSPHGSRPTCSVGIFRQNDTEKVPRLFESALSRADAALYASKDKGGNTCTLFDAAMEQNWQTQKNIGRQLMESETTKPFILHYQPYFDFDGKTLRGFEALIRMRGPDGKLVPPDKFIPLAEQNGSIEHIGARCLISACVEASNWPPEVMVSVNISPVQFRSGDLVVHIKTALELAQIPASQLEVEITESILVEDFEHVTEQLAAIKQLGVSIALDDFGTGYSSLSYLWRFPFNKIKIDRSFVQKLETDVAALKISSIIVELAKQLDLAVTAEGIETELQFQTLKELGCSFGQGYYLGKPMEDIKARGVILQSQVVESQLKSASQLVETSNTTSTQRRLHAEQREAV